MVAGHALSTIKVHLQLAGQPSTVQNTREGVHLGLENYVNAYMLASVTVGKDSKPRNLIVDTSYSMTWLPNIKSRFITDLDDLNRTGFDCGQSETCDRNNIDPEDLAIYYGKGNFTGYVSTDIFKFEGSQAEPVSLTFLEATKTKEYGNINFDGVLGLGCNTKGYANFTGMPVDMFEETIVDRMAKNGQIKNSMFSVNLDRKDGVVHKDALIIGGWHTEIVNKLDMINWYDVSNKFSLDVEFVGVGLSEIMVNFDGIWRFTISRARYECSIHCSAKSDC